MDRSKKLERRFINGFCDVVADLNTYDEKFKGYLSREVDLSIDANFDSSKELTGSNPYMHFPSKQAPTDIYNDNMGVVINCDLTEIAFRYKVQYATLQYLYDEIWHDYTRDNFSSHIREHLNGYYELLFEQSLEC